MKCKDKRDYQLHECTSSLQLLSRVASNSSSLQYHQTLARGRLDVFTDMDLIHPEISQKVIELLHPL
jgi:hypothetical protein